MGNFKALLLHSGCVRRIVGIQRPRSFELKTRGTHGVVSVGMKASMHAPTYSGMSAGGEFEGAAPLLFRGGIPKVEDAPPFALKAVDSDVIAKVRTRYRSVHGRVDDLFPCGELGRTRPSCRNNPLGVDRDLVHQCSRRTVALLSHLWSLFCAVFGRCFLFVECEHSIVTVSFLPVMGNLCSKSLGQR